MIYIMLNKKTNDWKQRKLIDNILDKISSYISNLFWS